MGHYGGSRLEKLAHSTLNSFNKMLIDGDRLRGNIIMFYRDLFFCSAPHNDKDLGG